MVGFVVLVTLCMPFVESKCNCIKKISEECCKMKNYGICCEHKKETRIIEASAARRVETCDTLSRSGKP